VGGVRDDATPQVLRIMASSLTHHAVRDPYTSCRNAIKSLTPKIATALFAETLEKLQYSTRRIPESRS
jgi:hypothetical protein